MCARLLVSPTARLTYGRIHQRAWVASLDLWLACREPTVEGSPATEAVCDLWAASRPDTACGEGCRGWRHDWAYEVDLRPRWSTQRGGPHSLQHRGTRTTLSSLLRDERAQTMPRVMRDLVWKVFHRC